MSLQHLAQTLAAEGRHGDSVLVHMHPAEVKGLQALAKSHGTSLTINPKTGMPEAFAFLAPLLGAILPSLTANTFLAPLFSSAMMTGLTLGGVEALRTGDIGKGFSAGLGAFGGANLASAFGAAGAAGNAAAAAPITPGVAAAPAFPGAPAVAATATTPAVAALPATPAVAAAQPFYGLQNAGQGFSNLGNAAGRSAFMENVGGGTGLFQKGMAAATPYAMQTPEITPVEPEKSNYAGPYFPKPRPVTYPTPGRTDSSEWTYFGAEGGVAGLGALPSYADGGDIDRGIKMASAGYEAGAAPEFDHNFKPVEIAPVASAPTPIGGKGALFSQEPIGYSASGDPIYRNKPGDYGDSGGNPMARILMSLMGRVTDKDTKPIGSSLSGMKYDAGTQRMIHAAGGRYLQGMGDGTSDSIPAVIADKRPARLADGEFVIDARTVSEIGNGSSNAGARKLYAMMDRVHATRKAAKRGKDANADRYLPA